MKYDFSGYATRNDLKCSDGRTIRAIVAFGLWAAILGVILSSVNISSIWILGLSIAIYGIIYLPVAFIIDRKI